MRTTVELPDELMEQVKIEAAKEGISVKTLFISALRARLDQTPQKPRLEPPVFHTGGPVVNPTREEIAEAMLGRE